MSDNEAWATRKEVNWLKKIGTHVDEHSTHALRRRIDFLRGYRDGIAKRVKWDAIAKDWMLKTVNEMIEEEMSHGKA